jgi:hypothetical protein
MSFKEWSAAHSAPAKDKPDDKSKVAPADDQPATLPNKTLADGAHVAKS